MPAALAVRSIRVSPENQETQIVALPLDENKFIQDQAGERQLILLCQKGDHRAFEELYRRHHRGLFLYLFSILRCRHTAEDVAQDIFLKLIEDIGSFRFQCSFGYWLFRVGRNAAIDRIRYERVRRTASLDSENQEGHTLKEILPDPGPLPSAKSERDEQALLMSKALSRLPAYARTALALREWDCLDYREIADKLGISIGTVKSRIFRGRRILARQLTQSGFPL